MDSIDLRPAKVLRVLWLLGWGIWFCVGLVVILILIATVSGVIFGLCLLGWLVVMLLVLVWIPLFHGSLEYVIDSDGVKGSKGVLWKKQVTVPFAKMTNLDVTRGPLQRLAGIGTIHVQTAGMGGPEGTRAELKLLGVREIEQTKERIMERVRGFTAGGRQVVAEKAAAGGESDVFERMLEELSAIREALEKRGLV